MFCKNNKENISTIIGKFNTNKIQVWLASPFNFEYFNYISRSMADPKNRSKNSDLKKEVL
jgi:hypothetical protein